MPTSGLPPGQVRRSGRARPLTAKAQQLEQQEAAICREDWEGDERDAMEGVLMVTVDPFRNTTDANEFAVDPPLTASIEMTGTEPLAQRPTASKDRHSAMTHNADGKRSGNAVKILSDLVRSLIKETKDQRKEYVSKVEGLMTDMESLQTQMAELTDTISKGSSTLYGPSPKVSYAVGRHSCPTAYQATSAQSRPRGQRERVGQTPRIAPSTPAEPWRKAQTEQVQGS